MSTGLVGSIQNTDYSVMNTENSKEKDKKNESVQEVANENKEAAAVYEKTSGEPDEKDAGIYSINKKSPADRAAIVQQMKQAEEDQRNKLLEIVQKTLQGQVGAYGKANNDSFWKNLAGGNFKVDSATRAQAQKDISEDGYYGLKQTSQRLFDFASALAGDDVDKMKQMQKAMEKGFKLATKAWGRDLPSICNDTLDAANKLFEDYYKSKEQDVQE